jgi:hypothetical protein
MTAGEASHKISVTVKTFYRWWERPKFSLKSDLYLTRTQNNGFVGFFGIAEESRITKIDNCLKELHYDKNTHETNTSAIS